MANSDQKHLINFPDDYLNSSFEDSRKHRSPSHRISILQKLRSRTSASKLKKSRKDKLDSSFEENLHSNKNYNNSNVGRLSNQNSGFLSNQSSGYYSNQSKNEFYISNKLGHDHVTNKSSQISGLLSGNREREKLDIQVCLSFTLNKS